jgi:hypothetical protein
MAKPQKCISVQNARNLYNNWQNTRAGSLADDGEADTCDFTFSLDEMQEFLDYVKEHSTKAGITNPGIRIYFAAYNNSSTNKATVFLTATEGSDSDSDNNYDIDPLNTVVGGWPPNTY